MAPEIRTGANPLKLLNALTFNQKISLVVLVVTVVAGITAMVYFVNQDEYQMLYSDLGPEEAGLVVEKLKAQKVSYRIGNSGRSIEVPTDRLNEMRLQLASEGLPQGGKIGFEIFDQNNMGMTEFVERVSYKRALEGELARTILSLKEIGQARVHLVLPKESMFEEKAEPTKASVIVKLKSGKALNESMISGIVHLVSSAVEGLTPDSVTVVDSNGRLLSGAKGTGEEALTGNQAELKIRTEKELTSKIVNILEPVVGQGKVRADASVVMDFSRAEQTEEKYDPQGVIRSQQKNEDHSDPGAAGATGTAAGVPGTKSNDANPPPVFIPTGKNASAVSHQTETTNYELSKVVRHTLEPSGQIKRLSVAVIVDDAVRTETGADGVAVRKSSPRGPEDLKKLNDLVGAAIGVDAKRGDILTVENIAFEAVPADLQDAAPTFLDNLKPLARPALRYGVLLVSFLLVYMLLVRPLSNRLFVALDEVGRAGRTERALTAGASPSLAAPQTVQEMEASLDRESSLALSPAPDVQKSDILKKRIAEFVQREPEKGAQVLRAWLTDEGK